MKVCFFLQRRFAYIGHAMACHLKEIASETEFCAVAQMRSSYEFIKNQKDIIYTSVLLDQEIHQNLYNEKIDYEYLKWLEEEYGTPNLWPYLYIDRIIMNGQFLREYPHNQPSLSRDDMLRCIQVNAKAIIAFLEKEKPDAVIFSVIGSVGSTLLYHIAKKMGIKTINMEFARIGNRIAFSENDLTFSWVSNSFKEIQDGRTSDQLVHAKKFLSEFRKSPAPYDASYMQEFYAKKSRYVGLRFLLPDRFVKTIIWYTKAFFKQFAKRKSKDYDDISVWWELWDKLKRISRTLIGYSDLYSQPNSSDRFAYFPLHIEPEIAIMRYAPYHTNQQEIIRAIAHALPIDMYLYVKEHPGMVGYRTRAYYKELRKIPNVKLIDPNIPGNELSKSAAITTTITSTAGWEAILCGKPAITFGDVYFNDISTVKRCHSFEELPFIIKTQLQKTPNNDQELVNYISALLEDSVEVNFQGMWNAGTPFEKIVSDEGMKQLSYALGKKLSLIST